MFQGTHKAFALSRPGVLRTTVEHCAHGELAKDLHGYQVIHLPRPMRCKTSMSSRCRRAASDIRQLQYLQVQTSCRDVPTATTQRLIYSTSHPAPAALIGHTDEPRVPRSTSLCAPDTLWYASGRGPCW